jgi:hypothetical protein
MAKAAGVKWTIPSWWMFMPVRRQLVGTELKAFIADEEAARLKHRETSRVVPCCGK